MTFRTASLLALVSGAALVVDCVTIAVRNAHFDPLDSVLFVVGFVGLWLTAVAVAIAVSSGRRGIARLGAAIAVFLGLAAALGGISFVADRIGRSVFSPANIGLHGEWSFFSIGVCLLGLAAWAGRRSPMDQNRP